MNNIHPLFQSILDTQLRAYNEEYSIKKNDVSDSNEDIREKTPETIDEIYLA